LVAAAHRAQADALEIEAMAKRRLADEYDAAQERGEVASVGQPSIIPDGNNKPATAEELGISRKEIHEAPVIRDAEKTEPGIVRRILDEKLAEKQEPTKAKLSREILSRPKPERPCKRRRAYSSTESSPILVGSSPSMKAARPLNFFARLRISRGMSGTTTRSPASDRTTMPPRRRNHMRGSKAGR